MSTSWKFMLATAIIWIIFDVYIIEKKGKTASISANVIRTVKANKTLFFCTLAMGVVLGHLFWSMDTFDYLDKNKLIQRCKDLIETEGVK